MRPRVGPAARALPSSVVELQRDLQSARAAGACNLPERGAAEGGVRIAPLRRIRNAVRLEAHLHVLSFADVEVLRQRSVIIDRRRSTVRRQVPGRGAEAEVVGGGEG